MKKNSAQNRAFSLIELSIVILIIGIIVAGVTQGSRLVREFKVRTAQTLTQSSPVYSIKNLMLWLEPVMDTSFLPAEAQNNSRITTWYDSNNQIAVRNNAVQTTSTNQPLYIEGVINGLPVVRFDGSSDFFTIANQLPELVGGPYSIFFVEQRRSAGRNFFFGGSSTANDNNLTLGYNSDTVVRHDHYSSAPANRIDFTVAGYSIPKPVIHSFLFNTTDGKQYWYNGGETPDGTSSYGAALSSFPTPYIGRVTSFYFNGDIAEVIVFNRYLKTEERQAIETYLAKKYAITLS